MNDEFLIASPVLLIYVLLSSYTNIEYLIRSTVYSNKKHKKKDRQMKKDRRTNNNLEN